MELRERIYMEASGATGETGRFGLGYYEQLVQEASAGGMSECVSNPTPMRDSITLDMWHGMAMCGETLIIWSHWGGRRAALLCSTLQ